MATADMDGLANLLEQSGLGWLLAEDRDARLEQIGREVSETSAEITKRLGNPPVRLLDEMQQDTAALKPLIQLFGSPTSTSTKAMVYCVLRGMEIQSLSFTYESKRQVSLEVVLADGVTGQKHEFSSNVVWDAEVLRHLGIMTMGEKPLLYGFYPIE
jgi:hypothetical protein